MTDARYTVGALLAFVGQLRTAPGYTQKAVSDIRSGTRMVLRHLNLEPDTIWDLEIVNDWAHAYADTHTPRASHLSQSAPTRTGCVAPPAFSTAPTPNRGHQRLRR